MKLIQVAQRAVDLDRAEQFYTRLLGVGPLARYDPPGLLFFDLDGVRLLLERGANEAVIYLAVPDVRATVEELREDDVEILADPHVIFTHLDSRLGPAGTDEWMAFLKDSEGNTVGLVSHLPRSPE
jgi:methylmalonyl-CoA/ethylmalonyl-CoA epimerase